MLDCSDRLDAQATSTSSTVGSLEYYASSNCVGSVVYSQTSTDSCMASTGATGVTGWVTSFQADLPTSSSAQYAQVNTTANTHSTTEHEADDLGHTVVNQSDCSTTSVYYQYYILGSCYSQDASLYMKFSYSASVLSRTLYIVSLHALATDDC